MNRDQLLELVEKIMNAKGIEQEINEWLDILEHNVPDPGVCDLIFYSSPPLTAPEVVDRALSCKPVQL